MINVGERSSQRRLLAWSGPEPRRVDVAHVWLGPDWLHAHGTSTCADYTLSFRIRTTSAWVTRDLDVVVEAEGRRRRLTLRRRDDGLWQAQRHELDSDGHESTTALQLPDLSTALDCDLGLCPLTNTMPILREGLVDASRLNGGRRVELQMAWVSVPDLSVIRSAQIYESDAPVVGGGAQIHYSAGDFSSHIEVDSEGLVVNYPSLGRRIAV